MTKDDKKLGLEKDKYAPEPERETPHIGRRKNTKRWCRGKVGREHVSGIVKDPQLLFGQADRPCALDRRWFPCIHMERCTVCGKVLRRWLPADECPERA